MVNSDGSLVANGETFAGRCCVGRTACKRICRPLRPPLKSALNNDATSCVCAVHARPYPNFPDPSSSPSSLRAAIDLQSPAFLTAARVCGPDGSDEVEIGG